MAKNELRLLTSLLSLLVVLAVLGGTNPSRVAHQRTVQRWVATESPMAEALGLHRKVGYVADYASVGFASFTHVNRHLLTIGVLNRVYVRKEAFSDAFGTAPDGATRW